MLMAAGFFTGTQIGSIQAAETIRLQYDATTIEVKVRELENWDVNKLGSDKEITPWITLLGSKTLAAVKDSLHKPISVDRQHLLAKLLDSWLGIPLKGTSNNRDSLAIERH